VQFVVKDFKCGCPDYFGFFVWNLSNKCVFLFDS